MRRGAGAFALLALLAWGGPVRAGSCTLVTPTNGSTLFDFGLYRIGGPAVDRSASVTLLCTPTLPQVTVAYSVSFSTGNSGSFNPRRLTAGAYGLNYNLYRDASRTLVWGDGSAGAGKVSGSCAATCVLTVYGRVTAGQAAPAAAYTDTVTLTIDF